MSPRGDVAARSLATDSPPFRLVAGVDEAGRGPLAGPVVAAAVVLDPSRPLEGLADSKVLSPGRRNQLAVDIRHGCLAWGVGRADAAEIDAINILQATLLAMRRALLALHARPTHVIVDGNRCPSLLGTGLDCTIESVVSGDSRVACVSAASILAKVVRDDLMRKLDTCYPGYGLARHKGYATAAHRAALSELGPSPLHRHSFAPVQLSRSFPSR